MICRHDLSSHREHRHLLGRHNVTFGSRKIQKPKFDLEGDTDDDSDEEEEEEANARQEIHRMMMDKSQLFLIFTYLYKQEVFYTFEFFRPNGSCAEDGKMVMGSLEDDWFSSLFHLTTNEMELSDRDQLAVTALAVLILYFLKRGGYFGGGDSTNKSNLR